MQLAEIRGELEERVRDQMEALHVPGVVVGILCGVDELVASFGVTNLDHPLDVTDTTLFQIGSTTKTFTATALMRKVEEGALDLDAPLQSYLPGFSLANPEWAAQVGLELEVQPRSAPAGWKDPMKQPPSPVGFHAQDRLVSLGGLGEGARSSFIRASDGSIEWLRWAGRIHRRR